MDQGLKAQIHRYAENREIDYVSARNLGNIYGVSLKNENELREWKQLIDRYLKTFKEDAFYAIEEACNRDGKGDGSGKGPHDGRGRKATGGRGRNKNKDDLEKKETVKEAYDASAYADDSLNDMVGGYQPGKKKTKFNPVKKQDSKRLKSKKRNFKKRSDVQESISLDDMFKINEYADAGNKSVDRNLLQSIDSIKKKMGDLREIFQGVDVRDSPSERSAAMKAKKEYDQLAVKLKQLQSGKSESRNNLESLLGESIEPIPKKLERLYKENEEGIDTILSDMHFISLGEFIKKLKNAINSSSIKAGDDNEISYAQMVLYYERFLEKYGVYKKSEKDLSIRQAVWALRCMLVYYVVSPHWSTPWLKKHRLM